MPARSRTFWRAAIAGALFATAGSAAWAGQVDVSFTQPEQFADAGVTPMDRQQNLNELTACLKTLGRQFLASDETLKVDFTQVDLAGQPKPVRNGRELRIVHGAADFPSLTLHYTLQRGDQVLAQGDDRLTDMDYTNHLRDAFSDQPLGYEKRMLDLWFHRRFAPRVAK